MILAITKLEEAMGITQHHDAVSGTAKKTVVNDYFSILEKGVASVKQV